MKKQINSLSKEDIAQIKEAVKFAKQRVRNNTKRPDPFYSDDNFPPEVYICYVSEKIPERVGTKVEGRDCQIIRSAGNDDNDNELVLEPVEDGDLTKFVINISDTAIPKDTYQIIQRDKFGEWYINSSGSPTTTEVGTGTATSSSSSTGSNTNCTPQTLTIPDVRVENGLLNKYEKIVAFSIENGCQVINEGVWKFKDTLGCISTDCLGTSTSTSTYVPPDEPPNTGTSTVYGTGTGTGTGDKCVNSLIAIENVTYGPNKIYNDVWFTFQPDTLGKYHAIVNFTDLFNTTSITIYYGTCGNLTEIKKEEFSLDGTYCIEFDAVELRNQCPYCNLPDNWEITLAGKHIAGTFTVPFQAHNSPNCTWRLTIEEYTDFPNWAFLDILVTYDALAKLLHIRVSGYKGGTFVNVGDYLYHNDGSFDCADVNTTHSIITDFYEDESNKYFSDISILAEPGTTGTPAPIFLVLTGSTDYDITVYPGPCVGTSSSSSSSTSTGTTYPPNTCLTAYGLGGGSTYSIPFSINSDTWFTVDPGTITQVRVQKIGGVCNIPSGASCATWACTIDDDESCMGMGQFVAHLDGTDDTYTFAAKTGPFKVHVYSNSDVSGTCVLTFS